MEMIGLKTCDTCRKARKALEGAGHALRYSDVRDDGVSAAQIQALLAAFGEDLVNTRSTTWRGLSEEARAATPLDLLQAHPTLMKRPVIIADGQMYLGWTPAVQAALL